MLYLLDANVLIDANRDYYPVERVPEFWDWLLEMGGLGRIKIPQEFFEEVIYPLPPEDRPDPLVEWLKTNKEVIVLDEEPSVDLVSRIRRSVHKHVRPDSGAGLPHQLESALKQPGSMAGMQALA